MNLKIKDINNIFIESISNIRDKIVFALKKDKFSSKISL